MSKINHYKAVIARIPVLGTVARVIWSVLRPRRHFPGSSAYWESRYAAGGTSGSGSYDQLAVFKANVINGFVEKHGVMSVMEFGCGDGNQLKLARYPDYLGLDISNAAIARCKTLFSDDASKRFKNVADYAGEKADLSMSLDVIYHLVEDSVFDAYMRRLFDSAGRYVIVYSSNDEGLNARYGGYHVKHRKFTDWVATNAPAWTLLETLPNQYPFDEVDPDRTSLADFYFYASKPR
jgi:hypothetical protein